MTDSKDLSEFSGRQVSDDRNIAVRGSTSGLPTERAIFDGAGGPTVTCVSLLAAWGVLCQTTTERLSPSMLPVAQLGDA